MNYTIYVIFETDVLFKFRKKKKKTFIKKVSGVCMENVGETSPTTSLSRHTIICGEKEYSITSFFILLSIISLAQVN